MRNFSQRKRKKVDILPKPGTLSPRRILVFSKDSSPSDGGSLPRNTKSPGPKKERRHPLRVSWPFVTKSDKNVSIKAEKARGSDLTQSIAKFAQQQVDYHKGALRIAESLESKLKIYQSNVSDTSNSVIIYYFYLYNIMKIWFYFRIMLQQKSKPNLETVY